MGTLEDRKGFGALHPQVWRAIRTATEDGHPFSSYPTSKSETCGYSTGNWYYAIIIGVYEPGAATQLSQAKPLFFGQMLNFRAEASSQKYFRVY